jgi:hypothetical protein
MISAAVRDEIERRDGWSYILGVRMRAVTAMRDLLAADDDPYERVSPRTGDSKRAAPLKMRGVEVDGADYVLCLNEDEATKDRHDREAIVAALRDALHAGDTALVGNKGYRRGPHTATALVSSVGHIHGFHRARCFASWLGLTPREDSTGGRRRLGAITKQGDVYLRCLLTHGARAVLLGAHRTQRAGKRPTALQLWALTVAARRGHDKATVAVANKLARIVWAIWHRDVAFVSRPAVAA